MVCLVYVLCYFLTVERYIFLFVFTNSRGNSGTMPTSDLFISSNCNFSSEGDRDFVFYLEQPCSEAICVNKEPLSAAISRLQRTDTLAQNIVKCEKIQNSLNILVLLKLQSHVTASLSCLFEAAF